MTAALDALRDATRKLAAPYASFKTATLIEAQASSAIEGIVTTVGEMIEHMDRPRLTNGADPDTHDALRYYDSIIDAWQHRGRESVGTRWRSGRVRRPRAAECGAPRTRDRDRRTARNHLPARTASVHSRVMTEAELLHHEPTNVTRRLSLASAAREDVAASLDLAAADRKVAAGRPAGGAGGAGRSATADSCVRRRRDVDRDRAESSFGLQPVWTSAGSVGVSQLLYSDGARARATIEPHVQTSPEQAREELRLDAAHGAAVGYLDVL